MYRYQHRYLRDSSVYSLAMHKVRSGLRLKGILSNDLAGVSVTHIGSPTILLAYISSVLRPTRDVRHHLLSSISSPIRCYKSNEKSTSEGENGNDSTFFDERMKDLRKFRKVHGHCLVPRETALECNSKQLGYWVQRLRITRKAGKLSPDIIEELDSMDFCWDVHDTSFQTKLDALRAFRNENGHCLVPNDGKFSALYNWIVQQRFFYRRYIAGVHASGLNKERIDALNEIGFIWNPLEEYWMKKYEELNEYKRKNGDCLVPLNYEQKPDLGFWVNAQRKEYKRYKDGKVSSMTPDRIRALERLGFVWNVFEQTWMENLKSLLSFQKENGHIRVPASQKQLRGWLNRQKVAYAKMKRGVKSPMTPERQKVLDEYLSFHSLFKE